MIWSAFFLRPDFLLDWGSHIVFNIPRRALRFVRSERTDRLEFICRNYCRRISPVLGSSAVAETTAAAGFVAVAGLAASG